MLMTPLDLLGWASQSRGTGLCFQLWRGNRNQGSGSGNSSVQPAPAPGADAQLCQKGTLCPEPAPALSGHAAPWHGGSCGFLPQWAHPPEFPCRASVLRPK